MAQMSGTSTMFDRYLDCISRVAATLAGTFVAIRTDCVELTPGALALREFRCLGFNPTAPSGQPARSTGGGS